MCTYFVLHRKRKTREINNVLVPKIEEILQKGRDAVGIIYITNNDISKMSMDNELIENFPIMYEIILDWFTSGRVDTIVIHSRAIPETENTELIQPIMYYNPSTEYFHILAFHGLLSKNDTEYLYNIVKPKKQIDKYIDAELLLMALMDYDITEILNEIENNYSFVHLKTNCESTKIVACNKILPMYIYEDENYIIITDSDWYYYRLLRENIPINTNRYKSCVNYF